MNTKNSKVFDFVKIEVMKISMSIYYLFVRIFNYLELAKFFLIVNFPFKVTFSNEIPENHNSISLKNFIPPEDCTGSQKNVVVCYFSLF